MMQSEYEAVNMEACVLGAILSDPQYGWPVASGILVETDFYWQSHSIIWSLMSKLRASGCWPDGLSVVESMMSAGLQGKIGGKDNYGADVVGSTYIMELMRKVVSALDIESHARIVLDASRRRSVIKAAFRVAEYSVDPNRPLEATLQSWGHDLDRIASRGIVDDSLTTLKVLAAQEADRLSALYNAGGKVENITTGFSWLDDALGGYQAGDLIIWSARPNTGKTRVLLYSLSCCAAAGNAVAFISLDMAKRRLLQYLIPTAVNVRGGSVYGNDLYNPNMWGEAEEARLRDVCAQADPEGRFFLVAEPTNSSMAMIESYCYKLAASGCRVLAIDQAQNIAGWEGGAQNRGEYTRIFKGLKQMARSYGLAVVLVHQIQRAGAGAPTLASLKDTGNAEEYSDAVLILHDTQRALVDAYGGFIPTGTSFRKPKATDKEEVIRRQVDITRPLRMGLDKNRNAETMRRYINYDFAKGVKA
jgi:replicative DNA helicase